MDAIPLALDGYLASDPVPGEQEGAACWRLVSSPTDQLADDATIPCTSTDPHVVDAVFIECRPGDLLRVTGHLTLPDIAGGVIRLHADHLEVLRGAPELGTEEHSADTGLQRMRKPTATGPSTPLPKPSPASDTRPLPVPGPASASTSAQPAPSVRAWSTGTASTSPRHAPTSLPTRSTP